MNNHELESTGSPLVDAALFRMRERNDERFKAMEEAWIVQSELERRQSNVLKSPGEWLEEHQRDLAQHRRFIKRHNRVMREIEDKLNALTDCEMRKEGL